MRTTFFIVHAGFLTLLCLLTAVNTRGQIIVNYGNGLAEFSAYGLPINTNLVSNLSTPQGIAIDDQNIYVAEFGRNSVGKYTLSGAPVNATLVSGLSGPEGLVLVDTNLFVASSATGTVSQHVTDGTLLTTNLVTASSSIFGLAISGSNLFLGNANDGTIGLFTTFGDTNDPIFLNGLWPAGISVSGTNLFVADYSFGTIDEFDTSGNVISSPLISGLHIPIGLAISGKFMYVFEAAGRIGLFTTFGEKIATTLFTIPYGGYTYFGIAVAPGLGKFPQPLLAVNSSVGNLALSWPTNGFAYLLEATPSLSAPKWTIITNTPFISNANYNITLPRTNTAQFFRLQSIN